MSDTGDESRYRTLAGLARALGVPLDAFFGPVGEGQRVASREEDELLDLFRALGDPQDRQRCLDLVRALVEASLAHVDTGSPR